MAREASSGSGSPSVGRPRSTQPAGGTDGALAREIRGIVEREFRNVLAGLQQAALQGLGSSGGLSRSARRAPCSQQITAAIPTAWALWPQVAITRVEPKATCDTRS